VLASQVGQSFEAGRQWVNSFEPSGDALLLLLRGLYESVARPAVRWHTVPAGLETALVLSHDVDARESFANSVAFARLEAEFGVKSTFFINTKTFSDDADIGYYDAGRIASLVTVRRLGFEIGSHSVAHSRRFAQFPYGEPVTAAAYRPAQAPTVLGEVQVSKELLDRDMPGQETYSFRAGELAYPPRLIEALLKAGYRYDSTSSANNIITNFPFFALERREVGGRESPIVEVPVTVDDSRGFLTAARVDEVTSIWTGIIEANRANAAMTCILIHPTDTTYKLEVERRILDHYRGQKIWVGTVAGLGDFWSRRAAAHFALERQGTTLVVRIDRTARALRGLALAVGPGGPTRVLAHGGKEIPYRTVAASGQGPRLLVLGEP
jgi:peptidoglycan/xylan/chitin deacetylase (PgdA/CDA1 family)